MNLNHLNLRDISASFCKNQKAERGGYHKKKLCLKILSSKFNYLHCNTRKKINNDFNDSSLSPIEELAIVLQTKYSLIFLKNSLLLYDFHKTLCKK